MKKIDHFYTCGYIFTSAEQFLQV
jgi:Leucine-rich repeat (LRR) protein